jgi:hypothetical protein
VPDNCDPKLGRRRRLAPSRLPEEVDSRTAVPYRCQLPKGVGFLWKADPNQQQFVALYE